MSTLLYDGDCSFCARCVARVPKRALLTTAIVPYQRAVLSTLGVTTAECAQAVQWVGPDGERAAGHAAIGQLLRAAGGLWWLMGTLLLVPPVSWLAAAVYRLVAANRSRLPGGTAACAAPAVSAPPTGSSPPAVSEPRSRDEL